ncbi:MAG: glycosyltransferase family 4 protein [Alphaproteobacteria bacterium]|nr:glycosyltransferase family 4 protein [Rhodospirillaceae bacterium]MBT6202866.1 glycosyltransferase family 4 protein [Rhodospirillaceae bacterium]MBT6512044.1 glycosyltransferase family 4 protein [Rhodospirillaceae bacterium]MDG2481913.1 glycosyltransferase family 4 protein [Alphaproteobacteria bacterium]
MARLYVSALESLGHEVFLASTLRSHDKGARDQQLRLANRGAAEAQRLVETMRVDPPDLWFTYHLYHKAPDHLGPRVADALGLPYIVAEPSLAPKQQRGPWAQGYAHSLAALARADMLLPMTRDDADGLAAAGIPAGRIMPIAPFLDITPYRRARPAARRHIAERFGLDPEQPIAVTVAMMRSGDKLSSYRVLAQALKLLDDATLQLLVVGDGPCRAEVEALLARHACFAGKLAARSLPAVLAGCDLCLWPAVNEAYGMALLGAQAAGLPVVAGHTRGVPEIVANGRTGLLAPVGDAAAFAEAITSLLDDPRRRMAMAVAAADQAAERHSLDATRLTLDRAITQARHAR